MCRSSAVRSGVELAIAVSAEFRVSGLSASPGSGLTEPSRWPSIGSPTANELYSDDDAHDVQHEVEGQMCLRRRSSAPGPGKGVGSAERDAEDGKDDPDPEGTGCIGAGEPQRETDVEGNAEQGDGPTTAGGRPNGEGQGHQRNPDDYEHPLSQGARLSPTRLNPTGYLWR
jgi:hypothetical protein